MCVSEAFKRLELLLQIKFCSGQMVQTRGSFSFVTQQPGDPADEGRLPACCWSGFLGRLVWLWRGRIARRLVSWETDAKVHGSLRLDLNWGPKFPGQSRRVKIGKRVCFWVEMDQDKREGKGEGVGLECLISECKWGTA